MIHSSFKFILDSSMGNTVSNIDFKSIADCEFGALAVKAYNGDGYFNKMISSLASPSTCPTARDRDYLLPFMRFNILASQRELWITIAVVSSIALIMALVILRYCARKTEPCIHYGFCGTITESNGYDGAYKPRCGSG